MYCTDQIFCKHEYIGINMDSKCGYTENCKCLIIYILIVSIILNIVINSSRGVIKRKLDSGELSFSISFVASEI